MYSLDENFVISGYEIVSLVFVFIIFYIMTFRRPKKEINPDLNKLDLILNKKLVREPIVKKEEAIKMEFTEEINGEKFSYNEKTKILKIGTSPQIEIELENGIEEFKEFIERLEEYVDED